MNYWNSLEQGSLLSRKFLFSSMNLKGTQTKLWCSSLEQQESPHLQSTLSNFREERAHLHFVHPSPHILWHLWIDHCYLCLTPWKGSVSPTYRMMGWCWRLSLHSQGNHTFFFFHWPLIYDWFNIMVLSISPPGWKENNTHCILSDTT